MAITRSMGLAWYLSWIEWLMGWTVWLRRWVLCMNIATRTPESVFLSCSIGRDLSLVEHCTVEVHGVMFLLFAVSRRLIPLSIHQYREGWKGRGREG